MATAAERDGARSQRGTGLIEGVVAAWLLVCRSEAVGKLRTVICQDFADLDRWRKLKPTQVADAAFVRHVAIDVHENPAGGTVDGHEQIAARSFIGHLWQVLDIDVNQARFVALKPLFRSDRFALCLRDNILQPRHASRFKKRPIPAREALGLMYCLVTKSRASRGE